MDTVKEKLDTVHGVRKSVDKIKTYVSGHSGHSSFIEKAIIKNIKKDNRSRELKNIYKENNRESTVSTVSSPAATQLKKLGDLDPRFSSQRFKKAVRLVLCYLGLDMTFGNFKKYDKKHGSLTPINWTVFAQNIENPSYVAIVNVFDARGRKVCESVKTLYGSTREIALATLSKCYEFVRWF